MDRLTTPVAFIIFNRPDTTKRVFEAIREAKPEKPKNAIEFQNIIKSIQSGELTHKNIHFFKAKKIVLETTEPLDWSMDGEHYVSPLCCEIESLRHRITLIC